MTTEVVYTAAANRDMDRLNRQVAQRVARAFQRYADTGQGDVIQLAGSDEYRLRVGG